MRILLVEHDESRCVILREGLSEAGCADIVVVRPSQSLLRRIADAAPDVIFIDLGNPDRGRPLPLFESRPPARMHVPRRRGPALFRSRPERIALSFRA